jgi:hypothetical protein
VAETKLTSTNISTNSTKIICLEVPDFIMNHVIVKQTKFNQQQGGEVIMAKNDK